MGQSSEGAGVAAQHLAAPDRSVRSVTRPVAYDPNDRQCHLDVYGETDGMGVVMLNGNLRRGESTGVNGRQTGRMKVVTDHDRPATKTVRRTTDGVDEVPVVIDLSQVALRTAENCTPSLPNIDGVRKFPPTARTSNGSGHASSIRTSARSPDGGRF